MAGQCKRVSCRGKRATEPTCCRGEIARGVLPRLDCARHAAAPGLREFVQKQCPLLAHSGHFTAEFQGPLLGVKRTLVGDAAMSAFDPRRTWTVQDCCIANWPLNPIPPVL